MRKPLDTYEQDDLIRPCEELFKKCMLLRGIIPLLFSHPRRKLKLQQIDAHL
jgi:hypothetical protein